MNDGLEAGDRAPNFTLIDDAGRAFLFYEFAVGDPILLIGFGNETGPEAVGSTLRTLNDQYRRKPDIEFIALKMGDVRQNAELADSLDLMFPLLTDEGHKVSRMLFGDQRVDRPGAHAVMLDRNLRAVAHKPMDDDFDPDTLFQESAETVARRSSSMDGIASMTAPVLIIPDILPSDLCRTVIDKFESWGPKPSAMPSIVDGKLEMAVDKSRKARLDVALDDPELGPRLTNLIARRVLPEIQKAFAYRATRFEQLKVVSYGADGGGYFRPHRDNTAPDTAHRRFALTLNLNTGDYDGGGLCFPEYGPTVYAPDAGAAIVFSGAHAHEVLPVHKGTRYALITFLWGEESAAASPSQSGGAHRSAADKK